MDYDFRPDDEISSSTRNLNLQEDESLEMDANILTESDQSGNGSQTQPKSLLLTSEQTNAEGVHSDVMLTALDQNQNSSQTQPKELETSSLNNGLGNRMYHRETPKVKTSSPKGAKGNPNANGNLVTQGFNISISGHFNQINFNSVEPNVGREHLDRVAESFRCKHRPRREKVKLRVQSGAVSNEAVRDVAEKVGAGWKKLGLYLDLDSQELDVLEYDYRTDGAVEICYRMISTWKEKHGSSATYKNLGNALLRVGRCDVVEEFLQEK